jgi:hypothetical protein
MEFISDTNAAMLVCLGLNSMGPAPGPDWPTCLLTLIRSILLLVTNYEGNILQYPRLVYLIPKSKTVEMALLVVIMCGPVVTH